MKRINLFALSVLALVFTFGLSSFTNEKIRMKMKEQKKSC